MTSARWQQIEALFEQALETPATERAPFLQAIDDAELRREVESLLDAHGEAGPFLDERERFFSGESFKTDTLSAGQIIERYRIVREIGRGGMGAVFLAERADDEYQKQVAIKLIKRGMDTEAVLRRFRTERQILAGFDHPNIARLFDGGTTESGLPYFVMEYVEGLPIDDYCNARALSVVERLKLFRDVCAAVSYAHRRLVIHRDIKPSNILITAEGVPKLLDFGIAKLLQEGDEPLATMTGLRPMTPASASPEQLRGEPVTTATDVYSLGVVLYELLCGCSPYQFPSQSPHEMARVITETEPKKPSTALAGSDGSSKSQIPNPKILRGDLDNIVLMALRKEPERRYQSVEQFSEDIQRHLEERPVLARKDTMGYRSAKFARRNKTALAAAAIVLLILIGGIVATSRQAQIAMREKARAERRFNEVRKLAKSVLFDYHDAIQALPGATKVRELLVKDALTYLDSLAGEAHGDPELQRELAAAYERLGDVRGGISGGSLGDPAGAAEDFRKALRIREALVAANPSDLQARRQLASTHQKLGVLLTDMSEATDGLEHFRKNLTLCLDLAREQRADEDLQFELAGAYNRLGSALSGLGDFAGALAQIRTSLAICEKLVASQPQNQRYRRRLWGTHDRIAYALWLQNDPAGAIDAGNKALALGEALIAEDPVNPDNRRLLVLTYQHDGEYRERSDKRDALGFFRKAAALGEELLAADPANALTRKDLAYSDKAMADFLADLGENSQALLHFSKALESYEKVVADAPSDLNSRFMVVTCRAGVARLQARLGDMERALDECSKAKSDLQKITGEQPGHLVRIQAVEYLARAHVALADIPLASASRRHEHTSIACDLFRQSLRIMDEARVAKGSLGKDEPWAAEITGELAKCDAALGK